ncbi:MAG: sugar phosphate isomerase/epimerase [Gemmatimonadaceae bacterium]|nr:sugar phosphate isomerase/epimerase [Gemmatimonadaceae bacterium]
MPKPSPDVPLTRRDFLARTGAGAALLATTGTLAEGLLAGTAQAAGRPVIAGGARQFPIGIEMFAVRKEMFRDMPNTLRTVKQIGYQAVEFFAPYTSWTLPQAKEMRTMIDDIGLKCFSTHNGMASLTPGETMSKAIEINQILGAKYVVLASPPFPSATRDGWMQFAGQLTAAADILRPHGLFAGLHNHDAEWVALEGGGRPMELIAANTPSDFVLQLDVGTTMKAGADPVAWIRANPGRIRSVHLKDWAPGTEAQEKSYRVLFGEGISPWPAIIAALESVGGVEFYLMEQEGSRFDEFETARRCLASWKQLRGNR